MNVLGVIPARGGSKRIKNKNIAPFCGNPMISYVLDAAQQSSVFDKIHVSTDSTEIARIAAELGAEPEYLRIAELADDFTPLLPVLKWVLEKFEELGQRYEAVFLIMPCAPLVEPADFQTGLGIFEQHGGQYPLMAMTNYPAPIEWAFEMTESNLARPQDPAALSIRSQDLTEKYYDAGMFDIYARDHLQTFAEPGEMEYLAVPVPPHRAIDIDTNDDWVLAEAIYRGLQDGSRMDE